MRQAMRYDFKVNSIMSVLHWQCSSVTKVYKRSLIFSLRYNQLGAVKTFKAHSM